MFLDQVALDDLGVLRIRGTDALTFLQGQLSNDLGRLEREGSLLAGLHNPQGRTLAVLRLLRTEAHDVLALLPRELTPSVAQRLGRYVLRSKAHISDESAAWRVLGVARGAALSAAQSAAPAESSGLVAHIPSAPEPTGTVAERWITVTPRGADETHGAGAEPAPSNADARRNWRLLDIAAGLPQVYARTSEQFVAQRLGRYVLRSKAHISDESAAWRVLGVARGAALSAAQSAAPAESSGLVARIPSAPEPTGAVAERWITVTPRGADETHGAGAEPALSNADARRNWRLLDIAAGLPQVYARTSEQFVAQMLNLDLIDAISFSKGCYTGQEVIARAHYRGRIKRRMQRWRTTHAVELAPGDAARLRDGRSLRVIEAAALPDGRHEFLAVAPLDRRSSAAGGDTDGGATAAHEASPASPETGSSAGDILIEAEPLPLPYELPV